MLLHHVGEQRLLSALRTRFGITPGTPDRDIVLGIGDDAAVVSLCGKVVVTTDMMNEGIHFDLAFTRAFHLGFKLVSVNVSDVMAMGGRARYVFIDFAATNNTAEAFFWDFFDGVRAALDTYDIHLLGGDLSSARHDIACSATVVGTADRVVTRGGAVEGDRVFVTGTLGDAAAGLEVLKRLSAESCRDVKSCTLVGEDASEEARRFSGGELTLSSHPLAVTWRLAAPLVKRHLVPVARDSSQIALHATAMMDVSDGLFIDLSRMCQESGVGVRLYRESIPVSEEVRTVSDLIGLDHSCLATAGGEDYEILFTARDLPDELQRALGVPVTCIGEIVRQGMILIDGIGRESPFEADGYQHFGIKR